MAGNRFRARTAQIATGTSAKTILQIIAASNHAVMIDRVSISFEGTSNTAAPIQVDFVRQTDAGTMGTSASSIVKDPDDWAETIQTTIRDTSSSEPSGTVVLESFLVHPQGGMDWCAQRLEQRIKIGGGDRLGIRVTAPADVDCIVSVTGEE